LPERPHQYTFREMPHQTGQTVQTNTQGKLLQLEANRYMLTNEAVT
jgi:hypothetical protein